MAGKSAKPEVTVRTLRIWDTNVSLEVDRSRSELRISPGESLEVTPEEATVFLNTTDEELSTDVSLHGILLDDRSTQIAKDAEYLRSQLPTNSLVVMLDATTIFDAILCIRGRATPIKLLDLSVLAFAAVCFDRIVVQPNPYIRLAPELEGSLLQLTYPIGGKPLLDYPNSGKLDSPQRFIVDTLWRVFMRSDLSYKPENILPEFELAWARLLGLEKSQIKLRFNFDEYQDSPAYWDGIAVPRVFSKILSRTATEDMLELLSVQTMRALFNDSLAGFLGIPYLASSFRGGVHSLILQRKVETQLLLDRLLSSIGPAPTEAGNKSVYVRDTSFPFVLGLILEKMGKPEDFWNILGEYRKRFEPLRRRLREARIEWDGRGGQYLQRMAEQIKRFTNGEPQFAERAVTTGLAVATTIASGTPGTADSGRLAIKLLRLAMSSKAFRKIYLKTLKPDVHLLVNLAEEAKYLRTAENRIKAIWGRDQAWGRAEHDQLVWLGSSYPGAFLKLRGLE